MLDDMVKVIVVLIIFYSVSALVEYLPSIIL